MKCMCMKSQYLNVIEEERDTVFNSLDKVGKTLYMVINRDPECTKEIIRTGWNEIQTMKNLLEEEKDLLKGSPLAEGVDDRIHLLIRLKDLKTLKYDLDEINQSYQPSIDRVATDMHMLEIGFCNLFCSVNDLIDILKGRHIDSIIREYERITRRSEAIFSRKGSCSCLPYNHPAGRAKWVYSLELRASKKYRGKNVLEKVKESGDYSLLYNREGIHLQVKDKRIFRKERELRQFHRNSILRYSKVYFPVVRELFIDVIPEYRPPSIA